MNANKIEKWIAINRYGHCVAQMTVWIRRIYSAAQDKRITVRWIVSTTADMGDAKVFTRGLRVTEIDRVRGLPMGSKWELAEQPAKQTLEMMVA